MDHEHKYVPTSLTFLIVIQPLYHCGTSLRANLQDGLNMNSIQ